MYTAQCICSVHCPSITVHVPHKKLDRRLCVLELRVLYDRTRVRVHVRTRVYVIGESEAFQIVDLASFMILASSIARSFDLNFGCEFCIAYRKQILLLQGRSDVW